VPAPWGRSRAEASGSSSGEEAVLASPVPPQADRVCRLGHRTAARRPPAAAVSRRSRAGGKLTAGQPIAVLVLEERGMFCLVLEVSAGCI